MNRALAVIGVAVVVALPVVGCAGTTVTESGPSGSYPTGQTALPSPEGLETCGRDGVYEIAHPPTWAADEECSIFTLADAADTGEGATIMIEALTQPYDEVIAQSPGDGAVREPVALAAASRAERVTYDQADSSSATPIVRYTVDLVPGEGTGETSTEQTLVITASATAGDDAAAITSTLEEMVQTLRITAFLPERGDPPS
jgi:hypothetical protein